VVDDPQMYQIALVDITFGHPGGRPRVRIVQPGGAHTLWQPDDEQAVPGGRAPCRHTARAADGQHLYYSYAPITTANSMEIVLSGSTGAPIVAGGITTVTLSITRV